MHESIGAYRETAPRQPKTAASPEIGFRQTILRYLKNGQRLLFCAKRACSIAQNVFLRSYCLIMKGQNRPQKRTKNFTVDFTGNTALHRPKSSIALQSAIFLALMKQRIFQNITSVLPMRCLMQSKASFRNCLIHCSRIRRLCEG